MEVKTRIVRNEYGFFMVYKKAWYQFRWRLVGEWKFLNTAKLVADKIERGQMW